MLYHKPASSAWPACSWAHSTNDCLIGPFVLLTGDCEWEERKTLSKQAVLTISIELHGCSSAQPAGPQGKCGGLSQCQTDFRVYKNSPLHFYFFSHSYSKSVSWSTSVKLHSVFSVQVFSWFAVLLFFFLKFWITRIEFKQALHLNNRLIMFNTNSMSMWFSNLLQPRIDFYL